MSSNLDPWVEDLDLEYLVMQLRHNGAPAEATEETLERPLAGRCRRSGLTIPECSCPACTRELIMRYRPRGRLG